jgi:hypothetical protein
MDFPNVGPAAVGTGITRTSAGNYQLAVVGTYEVSWQISITEPGQLELSLNGTPVPNSTVGRATGTNQIIGNTVVTTTSINTALSVTNPGGSAITPTPDAGGATAVSATLVIKRLA